MGKDRGSRSWQDEEGLHEAIQGARGDGESQESRSGAGAEFQQSQEVTRAGSLGLCALL